MPKPKANEDKDTFIERCIPIVIEDGTAEDGDQAYAICTSIWEDGLSENVGKVSNEDTNEDIGDFMWLELQYDVIQQGKPFDGMAPGEFYSMMGHKVIIKKTELPEYESNTKQAIEFTRTENGEIVGLPIDAFGHDNGDGAGWITDVFLEEIAKPDGKKMPVLRFIAKWTEIGRDLIEKKIRRMFSPTINTFDKVVMGGSLTNWPATRDKKGNVLLRPIELSQVPHGYSFEEVNEDNDTSEDNTILEDGEINHLEGVQKMSDNNEVQEINVEEMREQVLSELREQMKQEMSDTIAELMKPAEGTGDADPQLDILKLLEMEHVNSDLVSAIKETIMKSYSTLQEEARREAATLIAAVKRDTNIAEFVSGATTGSDEVPRGLPVERDALTEFCKSLNAQQFEFFTGLSDRILTQGLVEFEEFGHGKRPVGTKEMPKYYAAKLDDGTLTIADLENQLISVELGDIAEYDLSKWQK